MVVISFGVGRNRVDATGYLHWYPWTLVVTGCGYRQTWEDDGVVVGVVSSDGSSWSVEKVPFVWNIRSIVDHLEDDNGHFLNFLFN